MKNNSHLSFSFRFGFVFRMRGAPLEEVATRARIWLSSVPFVLFILAMMCIVTHF